jgi:hypothetical protein
LQYVATEGRHVADLPAGGERQSVADHRVLRAHRRMVLSLPHADQCAEAQLRLTALDAGVLLGQVIDVHG